MCLAIDWKSSHLQMWMTDQAVFKEEEVLKFKGLYSLLYFMVYVLLRLCGRSVN